MAPKTAEKTEKTEKAEGSKSAERRNLDLALQSIVKAYGDNAIMRLGDASARLKIDVIPTGCFSIDTALGTGGFPRGRIVEIFGPESSGKTTLTLTAIANAQKRGGTAAFIDVEHALDVVVVDSVAALVTKHELEGQIGDATVGAQARLMSSAMRKLTALISRARTVCIFTNQIREKIGVMFGNPETTPGGRALKFFASVRVDIRRINAIKIPDGTVIGNRTRVKIVKNKVAPPFTEAEFDILYNEGISRAGSLIDAAIEHNVVEKKGAWIAYEGKQLAQGRDAAKEELKKDPALYARIEKELRAKLAGKPEESAKAAESSETVVLAGKK